jgi:hypothetical protein
MAGRGAAVLVFVAGLALGIGAGRTRAQDVCAGDCDGEGMVGIGDLLVGVNIALGLDGEDRCPSFDANHDGSLEINELLGAVHEALQGCPTPEPTPTPTAPPAEEFIATESDFACLTDWTHVRHFRITNALGHLDDALAVAHGDAPPPYPVGTIIQLVPAEAMVKRGAGFFPAANDWEFFVLSATAAGTQIVRRGRDEVVNIVTPCFTCHSAATHTDLICETDNGCVALGLTEELINSIQNTDPRCPAASKDSSEEHG